MIERSKQEVDWDFIVDTIANGKCVLLLGPEICVTKEGLPFEQALLDYLNIKQNENIVAYYDGDGLFLFKDAISKTRIYYRIKECYNKNFQDNIYKKIVRLPFHLMISITPDLFVKEILEEESLILTHDDFFDFLLAILGGKDIPNELKNSLRLADNFIFLGFKFDKWYVQLLLRLLNLHKKNYKFARYASSQEVSSDIKHLCVDQFRIQFIEDNIENFVDQLFKRCKDEGLLREIDKSEKAVSQMVEEYIECDDIDKALLRLKVFLDKKGEADLGDEVTLLMGRHNRLKRKISLQIVDEKEAAVEENKIKVSLIEINREIKSLQ
jgi:hypothetical protein